METGVTGFREAVVAAMDPKEYPDPEALKDFPSLAPEPDKTPVLVKDAAEMFEKMRSNPVRRIIPDHEQFDMLFPEHPLSLVRARMQSVCGTLKLDKMWWQSIKPFRLKR